MLMNFREPSQLKTVSATFCPSTSRRMPVQQMNISKLSELSTSQLQSTELRFLLRAVDPGIISELFKLSKLSKLPKLSNQKNGLKWFPLAVAGGSHVWPSRKPFQNPSQR